jgi:hypothetical protein
VSVQLVSLSGERMGELAAVARLSGPQLLAQPIELIVEEHEPVAVGDRGAVDAWVPYRQDRASA